MFVTSAYFPCAGEDFGEAAEGADDDGIEGIQGGEFKNVKCTLTQQSIYEIAEPVEDSHQWIHDRCILWLKRKYAQYSNETPEANCEGEEAYRIHAKDVLRRVSKQAVLEGLLALPVGTCGAGHVFPPLGSEYAVLC